MILILGGEVSGTPILSHGYRGGWSLVPFFVSTDNSTETQTRALEVLGALVSLLSTEDDFLSIGLAFARRTIERPRNIHCPSRPVRRHVLALICPRIRRRRRIARK